MMLRPDAEYDTPLKPCKIKIDEKLYPSIMKEHKMISKGFDENGKIVTDCISIRTYILNEPFAVFKQEPFKVECDDGHCSMCYMADNRLLITEMEWNEVDFSKAMNPPEDGFDGQVDIKVDWVICPYCHKKQFKVNPDTRIKKMPYKCKNSKCQREFIVNV